MVKKQKSGSKGNAYPPNTKAMDTRMIKHIEPDVQPANIVDISSTSSEDFVSPPRLLVTRKVDAEVLNIEPPICDLREMQPAQIVKTAVTKGCPKILINLKPVIALIDQIKPKLDQPFLVELRKSPFWHLICCFINGHIKEPFVVNVNEAVLEITSRYDTHKGCFVFGELEVRPGLEDFRTALGITDGPNEVVAKSEFNKTSFFSRQPLFVTRQEAGGRLTSTIVRFQLLAKLSEPSDQHTHQDVARLLTLFVMGALVLRPPLGLLPWFWVEMLDNYDSFGEYNWSKCVMDTTMISVNSGTKRVGGIPLVLLVWFCEHTNVVPCSHARFWPRLLKWDYSQLSKLSCQRKSEIYRMVGVEWSVAKPICYCEWDKLGNPDSSDLHVECLHGGDTYLGNSSDNSEDEQSCSLKPEILPDGYLLRSMDADGTIQVQKIELGKVYGSCDSEAFVHIETFLDAQGYPAIDADSCVDSSDSESFQTPTAPTKVVKPRSLSQWTITGESPEELYGRNPYKHESPACQALYGWGIHRNLSEPGKKLDFLALQSENNMNEGEQHGEQSEYIRASKIDKSADNEPDSGALAKAFKFDKYLLERQIEALKIEITEVNSEFSRIEAENIKLQDQVRQFSRSKVSLKPRLLKPKKRSCRKLGGLSESLRSALQSEHKIRSVIRLVKGRADRKVKKLSAYTYHSKAKAIRRKRGRQLEPIPMIVDDTTDGDAKNKKPPVEGDISIDQGLLDAMARLGEANGPNAKVWKGVISGDSVIVKEAYAVFNGADIQDSVVNCWGEIKGQENAEVLIVDAGCHGFIKHFKQISTFAKRFIDSVLESFRSCKMILFPINSTGSHWTLLVLDLVARKWFHYNSIQSADERDDVHLAEVAIVKEYVESKIAENINRDGCGTIFGTCGQIINVPGAPQQGYGTVDCGIFVCILMERLVSGRNPTEPITAELVANFRRKMVRVFIEQGLQQA